jgi:hypothetical protein
VGDEDGVPFQALRLVDGRYGHCTGRVGDVFVVRAAVQLRGQGCRVGEMGGGKLSSGGGESRERLPRLSGCASSSRRGPGFLSGGAQGRVQALQRGCLR